jgi:hypothetical protein
MSPWYGRKATYMQGYIGNLDHPLNFGKPKTAV